MFYFNQFFHNLSNHFLKNLMLIRFKRIEANYLYVYQRKFILKISHMTFDTKRQVATQKINDIKA